MPARKVNSVRKWKYVLYLNNITHLQLNRWVAIHMKLRKKKNPVTMNTKEMHANHLPKVLWYYSHGREGGRGAGNSLMLR